MAPRAAEALAPTCEKERAMPDLALMKGIRQGLAHMMPSNERLYSGA